MAKTAKIEGQKIIAARAKLQGKAAGPMARAKASAKAAKNLERSGVGPSAELRGHMETIDQLVGYHEDGQFFWPREIAEIWLPKSRKAGG